MKGNLEMKKLLISALVAVMASASVNATVISEYTSGQTLSNQSNNAPGYYWGLSVFFDDQQGILGWNDLAVTLFGVNGGVALGSLYAFTSPQYTTAADLSSSTPFAVGSANNGSWIFGSSDLFSTNQTYHFYGDTFISQPVYGFGGGAQPTEGFSYALDVVQWQNYPNASSFLNPSVEYFELEGGTFVNHSVTGNIVTSLNQVPSEVPEPAGVLRMGSALLGLGLWRRRS